LRGERFDLGPLIDGEGEEGRERAAATSPPPPLTLRAHVDILDWGPDRQFRNVTAEMRRDAGAWQRVAVTGHVADGAAVQLDYGPAEGGYAFRLSAEDAGQTLAALDWTDHVRGGTIVIEGRRPGPGAPFQGDFRLARYK